MPSESARTPCARLGFRVGFCVGLCLCACALPPRPLVAAPPVLWKEEEQRFRVALKLFPACLGAVEPHPDAPSPAPDAPLSILVAHLDTDAIAQQAAASLRELGAINRHPLAVALIPADRLDDAGPSAPDAIFVASVGVGGRRLRAWSERYRTLVFSPFAGDVEAGAVAGIHVADRILPAVNLSQARRAGVRFKPFFLQVAHRHD